MARDTVKIVVLHLNVFKVAIALNWGEMRKNCVPTPRSLFYLKELPNNFPIIEPGEHRVSNANFANGEASIEF